MLEILKKKRQEGFTLVELLIVIVIIAILAALVIVTFTGVQARARNTERQTDVSAVAKYLELYYTSASSYPNTTQMTGTPDSIKTMFQNNNAGGFDTNALQAPNGATNSFKAVTAATPTTTDVAKNEYGYKTLTSAGAACAAAATDCQKYVLYWTEEPTTVGGSDQIKSKASAN